LQLFAEAEASDTASSVASNVRRRVIVRQNLQHRRQARSELRRNVAPIQSSVHGQIQAEFATGSIERSPRVDRPDRSPDFAVSWRLEARHTPTRAPSPSPGSGSAVGDRRARER
jgi:hypothetical protein